MWYMPWTAAYSGVLIRSFPGTLRTSRAGHVIVNESSFTETIPAV